MALFRERYTHFLFDLDGTLIDSFEDIKASFESSCAHVLGKEVRISVTNIGPPLSDMIDNVLPGLEVAKKEALISEFRSRYDNCAYENTFPIKGALEVLQSLRNHGRKSYVVTNKAFLPTNRILERLGFDFLQDVVSPDRFGGRKLTKTEMISFMLNHHKMDGKEVVMVGDTVLDIEAARANGVDSVGVTSGYESMDQLMAGKPTYLVDDINALLK